MLPRNERGSHRLNNNYTRQKQTNELINFAILNDIISTVNLNNKTTRINSIHES